MYVCVYVPICFSVKCFAAFNYFNMTECTFTVTVDSRYLEVEGTLSNTSRYPYFDISDLQNREKYQTNNQISQLKM